jgi:hypothetical protein
MKTRIAQSKQRTQITQIIRRMGETETRRMNPNRLEGMQSMERSPS